MAEKEILEPWAPSDPNIIELTLEGAKGMGSARRGTQGGGGGVE